MCRLLARGGVMANIPEGIPPEVGHAPANHQQADVCDRDALEDDDSRGSSTSSRASDSTAAPRVGDCLFSQSTVQEQMRHCELA